MRGGGRLFLGGGGVTVDVCAHGFFLALGLREVFVCEFGAVQGGGYHIG